MRKKMNVSKQALFLIISLVPSIAAAAFADLRLATEKFALSLSGKPAGYVSSAEGGQAISDIVIEAPGQDRVQHKHLSGLKYEDIQIAAGSLNASLAGWIKDFTEQRSRRLDGEIYVVDYRGDISSSLEFRHALITEIGFPALDAGSKEPAKLTVK